MTIKDLLATIPAESVGIIDILYYNNIPISDLENLSYIDYSKYTGYGTIGNSPTEEEMKMTVIKHQLISRKTALDAYSNMIPQREIEKCAENEKILIVLAFEN